MQVPPLFTLLFVAVASCADIIRKDVTPRAKTRMPAIICASHLSSTVAHFDALIDLFCFKQINKNVFIDNTEDKKAIQAFYDFFEEQRKKGAIDNFEEKWGARLAVFLASFYLSHVEPNSLPQLQSFISTVSLPPREDSGLASMAAIRAYLELEELPGLILEWEAALTGFLVQMGQEEGKDVGKFMAAMFPGSNHMTIANFFSQFPLSESGIRLFCDSLFDDKPVPVWLHDKIMHMLDSSVSNVHINWLLGESKSSPEKYADFLAIAKAVGGNIYWHNLANIIVEISKMALRETYPELSISEVYNRTFAAMEKSLLLA